MNENMSDDPSPIAADFLRADDVVKFMIRNFEIRFKTRGDDMTRDEAHMHFKNREALCRVRTILVNETERIGLPPNLTH